jgi:hypothetical protein
VQYQTSLCTTGQSIPVVAADKCREIERELISAKAEVDALKRRLGQHDVCNGVMGESGYVPECISLRAEVKRLRGVLTAIVDFVDGPAEDKRPDVFGLRINAARTALKEPK